MDKCAEVIKEPPWYIDGHRCDKRAKYWAEDTIAGRIPLCGTHIKWYRKTGRPNGEIGNG